MRRKSVNKRAKYTRVYELARELGVSSRTMVEELRSYGVNVKNHMSTLDPEMVQLVITEYSEQHPEDVKAEDEEEIDLQFQQPEALEIEEGITVGQLAKTINAKPTDLIKRLMTFGIIASINQVLNYESLETISEHFGFKPLKKPTLEDILLKDEPDDPSNLGPRSPVVTIMGHVDHGKTSLLDAIRKTNVMDTEAGGITQHIGAYHVNLENGSVVFLDTPGHAAFTAMRARGAKVTDVVVLVVAADDGVMPQTVEAINHAKAAGVSILVAINKIDKPDANPEGTKRQLAELGLMPEEWGGQNIFADISAKNVTGLEELLELLLLEADLLELKANPSRLARGTVIEAKLDKGRGPVATVLVRNGTLRIGDAFIAGLYYGKVRAMINDRVETVREAGPSIPVEVLGFTGVPQAGDKFYAIKNEKDAQAISELRLARHREDTLNPQSRISLEDLYKQIREGNIKELNIIIKGDVQGSVEAITESLMNLNTREVKLNLIHRAVGNITETDVLLASASNAIIIGFNVRPTGSAFKKATIERVEIRTYDIIYNVIADVRAAMEGLLEPEIREVLLGRAEVRELFKVPRLGVIAGSYVNNGRIVRNQSMRVLRGNREIFSGKVDSLRRFKDNINEVASGYECGIGMEGFNDFQVDDILECYTHEKITRRLS
ncbi:translation initiation factor IF-2 [bacterium]|nr:translation initiation factor IF-2 [bacterium]